MSEFKAVSRSHSEQLNRPQIRDSRRRQLLGAALAGSALAAVGGAASAAWAAPNACGPATSGTVTCTPANNPYPTGIQYQGGPSLQINLEPGVVIQSSSNAPAVSIANSGTASGTVVAADDVVIDTGGTGISIAVSGGTGNATIDSGAQISAVTRGLSAFGGTDTIVANRGAINVIGGNGSTTGSFAQGIIANANRGDVTVTNSGAIEVSTGTSVSQGIITITRSDNALVLIQNSGDITVTNSGSGESAGILVRELLGVNSSVGLATTGSILVESAGDAVGIRAEVTGGADIDATGPMLVVGSSATGIQVGSEDAPAEGSITIAAGDILVAGTGEFGESVGILAVGGESDITIDVGTIGALGASGMGIDAQTSAGDISITSGTIVAEGGDGIDADSDSGSITVNSGLISTTEGVGIDIGTSGDGEIRITSGSVITDGGGAEGINAETENGAIAIVSGSVTTSGDGSDAILAESSDGAITIASSGAIFTVGEEAAGINASTGGTVAIANSGSINTFGPLSNGIFAVGEAGATVTGRGSISTGGDEAFGVLAFSGLGDVSVTTGTVATAGDLSVGIAAISDQGLASVDATSVTTSGDTAPAIIAAGTTGARVTAGSVFTTGADSSGIAALADGPVSVTSQNVTVLGTGSAGILAAGTGNVVVNSGNASAFDQAAISAVSDLGAATVTISGGTSSTQADAVSADAGTVATVNVGAAGSVTGGVNAITITGIDGSIVNNSGRIIAGSGFAIDAAGGPATITNAGTIAGPVQLTAGADRFTNSGTFNAARTSQFGDGNDVLTNSGTTNVAGALNFGGGDDALTNSGTTNVAGTIDFGLGNDSLTNSGTTNVTGTIDFGAGNDVVTSSGTFNANGSVAFGAGNDSLTNSGTFNSNAVANLGDGNDVLTNSGTFNANANTDFGAGTDTFNNSGTVRVLFGRPAGTVTFVGLEATNNSGLIDLRNGRTGDTLNLPGTFTGSGASQLGLDVSLAAPGSSDRLVVGNAQGSTSILLNVLGGNAAIGTGPTLVQASSASAPGAFTLAGGPIDAGLVRLELVYNPTNFSFALTGTPSDAAFRTGTFVEAARSLWHKSAEAWSAQMREARDTLATGTVGEPGGRFWLQGYGSKFNRDLSGQFAAFGASRTVDLSYQQDFFGGQIGFDFGAPIGAEGGFGFGVTGGYVDSTVNFRGAGDDLDLRAANAGVYARFAAGPFFVNGLAKYDKLIDGSARSLTGGFDVELDGDAYGAMLEAGLRIGVNAFFVEPVASIAYVKSDFDGFEVLGTSVEFDADDGLRGKAGARVGTSLLLANGTSALLYGGAHYVHEFSGEDNVRLASGTSGIDIDGRRVGDYVEGLVGLGIAGTGPVSGFFEGSGSIDNDHDGFGVRAGLRVRF